MNTKNKNWKILVGFGLGIEIASLVNLVNMAAPLNANAQSLANLLPKEAIVPTP